MPITAPLPKVNASHQAQISNVRGHSGQFPPNTPPSAPCRISSFGHLGSKSPNQRVQNSEAQTKESNNPKSASNSNQLALTSLYLHQNQILNVLISNGLIGNLS